MPRPQLKQRHLQLLVALDEQRNLARVAEQLSVTPPAVSKALREAEQALGAELFRRGPRGVTPTIYGECMVGHARAALAELAKAATEIRALQNGSLGATSLGVLPAAAPLLAPMAIAGLKERAPLTAVLLREGTVDALLPELHSGKLDIVVGTVPPPRLASGLAVEVLCDDAPVVVVARIGHPLARRRRVRLAQLLEFPWIVPPGGTSMGDSFRQMLAKRRLPLAQNYVESGSVVANKTLIQRTDSLGFFTRQIARHYAEQKLLCVLGVELGRLVGPIGVLSIKGRAHSPSTQLMLECLRRAGEAV